MTLEEYNNPDLNSTVEKNNPLKSMLIEYVGNKLNPHDKNVTVQMIIDVLADEFPEVLLAIAEENFLRGYSQGLSDVNLEE